MGDESRPGAPDPDPPDPAADYDLYSWAVSLGVTLPVLRRAIAEVGHSAVAVRKRLLDDRRGRPGPAKAKVTPLSEPPASK
ncbi:MAG: hypothetical protein JWM33_3994 [Caulobacteraceae bacterium]|nr:hypothetical protein [Caulobacteraceae bacterium]